MSMRLVFTIVAAGAFTLLANPSPAQPRYDLSPEVYAVFSKWMTSSCLGDEARTLRDSLRRFRAELAPAFRKALEDGPPVEEVRVVRAGADARYDDLAKFRLQDYRVEGVNTQDRARFARVTRESFVADQTERYANGYRSNAVAGLAIVGESADRALLTRVARRQGDPLAPAAREALKMLGAR
jgi:hypothetical protein